MAWRLIEIPAPEIKGDLTNWEMIGIGLRLYPRDKDFDPVGDPFHRIRQKIDDVIRRASSEDPDS